MLLHVSLRLRATDIETISNNHKHTGVLEILGWVLGTNSGRQFFALSFPAPPQLNRP